MALHCAGAVQEVGLTAVNDLDFHNFTVTQKAYGAGKVSSAAAKVTPPKQENSSTATSSTETIRVRPIRLSPFATNPFTPTSV